MSAIVDEVRAKLDAGVRLSFDDGVRLMKEHDVGALGVLANRVRQARHGDRTYFNVNMHLNATNVCVADCHFCSFARLEEGMPGAYTMTVEEAAAALGISRAFAYEAITRNEIPHVRIGRRILVPRSALERMLGASES